MSVNLSDHGSEDRSRQSTGRTGGGRSSTKSLDGCLVFTNPCTGACAGAGGCTSAASGPCTVIDGGATGWVHLVE